MNLAIIGDGEISYTLASFLDKQKHHVTVAIQQPEQIDLFSKVTEKTIVVKGFADEDLIPLLMQNSLLVIPLSSEFLEESAPVSLEIAHAIRRIALHSEWSRRLLMISSTAVYGDHHGLWVDETSPLKAKTSEGKMLIEAERIFHSLTELGWQVSILRVAEIYGPKRELSKRFSSIKGPFPGSGSAYTNMIHEADLIAAVDYTIRHHLKGIYNVVDDVHPTREQLYKQLVDRLHLPSVKWNPNYSGGNGVNKRVSNHKIKAAGFSLQYAERVLE
jgi:nucleoside-diphosphate-sugar epimerase